MRLQWVFRLVKRVSGWRLYGHTCQSADAFDRHFTYATVASGVNVTELLEPLSTALSIQVVHLSFVPFSSTARSPRSIRPKRCFLSLGLPRRSPPTSPIEGVSSLLRYQITGSSMRCIVSDGTNNDSSPKRMRLVPAAHQSPTSTRRAPTSASRSIRTGSRQQCLKSQSAIVLAFCFEFAGRSSLGGIHSVPYCE